MAGGENLFGKAGEHSPWMKFEELAAGRSRGDRDCAVRLRHSARVGGSFICCKSSADGNNIRAVRDGRVFLADGNQYFNRPGPRIVESLQILAELIHPHTFRFGFEGDGLAQSRA